LDILEKRQRNLVIENESQVEEYYQVRKQLESFKDDIRHVVFHPAHALPFLQPGRFVHIRIKAKKAIAASSSESVSQVLEEDLDYGWGVIVSFQKRTDIRNNNTGNEDMLGKPVYAVDVLLPLAPNSKPSNAVPCPKGVEGNLSIVPVTLDSFHELSAIRVFLPKDIKTVESKKLVNKMISEVKRRFPEGIPLLDPVEDLGINDDSFVSLVKVILDMIVL
jgi:ATP-dependent RNA helicase DOB1